MLSEKLIKHYPGAQWNMTSDNDYSTLEWFGPGAKPTEAELNALTVGPRVPQEVTMSQARKAIIMGGLSIASIDTAISEITDPVERELAQTDWEYSTRVRRASPLISSLGPILGLNESQIDDFFILAETLD